MSIERSIVKQSHNQYLLAFKMLENILNAATEEIYNKKVGSHIFWQQILHALMGSYFWFRTVKSKFNEPFIEKKYYSELEKDPENIMPIKDLKAFFHTVNKQVTNYFNILDDNTIFKPCVLYPKLSNYEIISMQIRHMMYHVGYLNGLLSEYEHKTIPWLDYFG